MSSDNLLAQWVGWADRFTVSPRGMLSAWAQKCTHLAFTFLLTGVVVLCAQTAMADEVSICYNYDCAMSVKVKFRYPELSMAKKLLQRRDAAGEREAISRAIGLFEDAAGQQAPTGADKGRNLNDDGINGRMDCIDESRNTTDYLRLLESKGWLKYHRVLDPVVRAPLLVNDHWAARIVEIQTGLEFAVDSWFFDNGQPAFVAPMEAWRRGAEPNEE